MTGARRRPTWRAALTGALLAGAAGCVDTNITEPGPGTGGVIYFASNREGNNFEIYRIAGDGAALRRLTNDPANDRGPVASPDGSRIAWVREIANPDGSVSRVDIWIADADGSNARAVVSNGTFNDAPSWMPDGTALVYATFATGNWEIFRVGLDGSGPVNLTNDPYADQHPRVSPDGRTILFHTNRDLNFEIYAINANGSNPRNLTGRAGDDRFAAWSPDGTMIVWSRFIDSFDLYAMNATGGDQRPIVASPFLDLQPTVSPDGRRVVFQTDRIGSPRFTLYVVSLDGGEPTPVIDASGTASDLDPYWTR